MKAPVTILILFVVVSLFAAKRAFAHCDTLDGPVAVEARTALENGDVSPLLKWVDKADEDAIKTAFEKARDVRDEGAAAQELADMYFLETLIRIHRASEGAPFTGLKPAGTIEPVIAAADKAIAANSADTLAERLGAAVEKAVKTRFQTLKQAEAAKEESIEAGRAYVRAYVDYVHFVERLHLMISGADGGHDHSPQAETDSQEAAQHAH